MFKRLLLITLAVLLILPFAAGQRQKATHTFFPGPSDFFIDGAPYQIISAELHPARIPAGYWRHRIQMARAMGCNTITAAVFWNFHETEEGVFDFIEDNRNLVSFFQMVKEEGMWLLLKPGPFVSDDWNAAGIPAYISEDPERVPGDEAFMMAAERYIKQLSVILKPFMVTNGGPLLMLQLDDHYGSRGDDPVYLEKIKDMWVSNGVTLPFFTNDLPEREVLLRGTLKGCITGLSNPEGQEDLEEAQEINPGLPVFCSSLVTGSATVWGGDEEKADTALLHKNLRFLLENKKSFNIQLFHGGTNFDNYAGAYVTDSSYRPVRTSHDFNAPVDEQGFATEEYHALKKIIAPYLPLTWKPVQVPEPPISMETSSIGMNIFTSFWDNLPEPVKADRPLSFGDLGQMTGFVLYRTKLKAEKGGKLVIKGIHDYANIFIDGVYSGTIDRRKGNTSLEIPAGREGDQIIDIFTEAMGRPVAFESKGITGEVSFEGEELSDWEMFSFPMDPKFIYNLRSSNRNPGKRGIFFRGSFFLSEKADVFLDMSNFSKGVVWVNGNNLGRFWDIGPGRRLFCPAGYMREGSNEIIVFDLHRITPAIIIGKKTPIG